MSVGQSTTLLTWKLTISLVKVEKMDCEREVTGDRATGGPIESSSGTEDLPPDVKNDSAMESSSSIKFLEVTGQRATSRGRTPRCSRGTFLASSSSFIG